MSVPLSRRALLGRSLSAGQILLAGESEGLGIDATVPGGSVAVRDNSTPGNNTNEDINWLTNAGTSTKWVRNAAGVYVEAAAETPVQDNHPTHGWGLLVEPAATNLLLRSSEFDNASWLKSGTPVVTGGQASPDGGTGAYTLTDNNAAGFGIVQQAVTVADDSVSRTGSIFIKKDSDETRFPEIQFTYNIGTTVSASVQLNTKTGATVAREGSPTIKVEDVGSWWRLSVTSANNSTGNTNLNFRVFPAVSTTFGTAEASATGSVTVWHAQNEVGSIATSPIPTAGATVTRAKDLVSVVTSKFPYNNTGYTVYVKYTYLSQGGNIIWSLWNSNTNWTGGAATAPNGIAVNAGSFEFGSAAGGDNLVKDDTAQISTAFEADNFAVSRDGMANVTDVSGAMPAAAATELRFSSQNGEPAHLLIQKWAFIPRRVTNGDLPTWRYAA